jgi:hypothetical protein
MMRKHLSGAQRRIEARIGQLLGPPKVDHDTCGRFEHNRYGKLISPDDRRAFRLLARVLKGDCQLSDDEMVEQSTCARRIGATAIAIRSARPTTQEVQPNDQADR